MLSQTCAIVLSATLALWPLNAQADQGDDFVRAMNLGRAHLENRNSEQAVAAFERAVRLRPHSAPALRNLARARMLTRAHEPALAALTQATAPQPDSAATNYLTGLVLSRLSRPKEALPQFEAAVRLDPRTPALRYQLALAYQIAGEQGKAQEQLRETLRLDPLHGGAHFRIATAARQAGQQEEFRKHYQEFTRLQKLFGEAARSPEALEKCIYTQPEPADFDPIRDGATRPAPGAAAAPAVSARFCDASQQAFRHDADRRAAVATVLEVEPTGQCVLFIAAPEGGLALLRMPDGRQFQRVECGVAQSAPSPNPQSPHVVCIVGDYHNDVPTGARYDPAIHAFNDVLLAGPGGIRLLKRMGPSAFRDATQTAGLSATQATGARWVDYDHDGDLDLLTGSEVGLRLWQNNGNAAFEEVSAKVGVTDAGVVVDLAAVDLDANVAVDVVAAHGEVPTLVFENQRAGRFSRMSEPPGPWPPARRILANELDNDGRPDVALVGSREVTVVYGRSGQHGRIDLTGLDVSSAVLIDYDNDGWLDLGTAGAAAGSKSNGVIRLYRNEGGTAWKDVTDSVSLATLPGVAPVRDLIAVDADNDQDTDLLAITTQDRLHLFRNDGGHAAGQLKLRLTTIKTNPAGIGTHIEIRSGNFTAVRDVDRLPIEIGLAGNKQLDSIQTIWANGVIDNQIDVAVPTGPLAITEKNVAAGSCPFLYAWDGRRFRFVTDLLGNSPIGLPLKRDIMLAADPDEIVWIGDAVTFPPRNGLFTLEVTDEFREVLYLDEAKLLAIDHPPTIEIHPTDKLMPPPFPPSELWALKPAAPLRDVVSSDGVNRLDALRLMDGVFAPPGPLLPPPHRGMCHPLTLTLDFGPLEDAGPVVRTPRGSEGPSAAAAADPEGARRPLVLALTGWLQYGDASTNIALSQNPSLTIIPPSLECETSGGRWQPVDVVVGMPAGKTKTILCDLARKLPSGARRLRLTTTFEIRWDRIALFERVPLPATDVHDLRPARADLHWRGFSEIRSRAEGHPTTPDHDAVSPRPPWRTALEGFCTRYGDVLELVTHRDSRLAIVSAGDELTLQYPADALPPLMSGNMRTFFFYSVGWDKDGDPNVATGETIEPLPTEDSTIGTLASAPRGGRRLPEATATTAPGSEEEDWRLQYNTRFVPRDAFAGP